MFDNDLESTIILCCLENEVTYFGGIKKLCPDKKDQQIKRAIDHLLSIGQIQQVKRQTRITQFFNSLAFKNCKYTGEGNVRKMKYYELTSEGKDFFGRLKGNLLNASKHTMQLENYKKHVATTHKARQIDNENMQKELWKSIEILRRNTNSADYQKLLTIHANNVLLRKGITLTQDELDNLVKTLPPIEELRNDLKKRQKKLHHYNYFDSTQQNSAAL